MSDRTTAKDFPLQGTLDLLVRRILTLGNDPSATSFFRRKSQGFCGNSLLLWQNSVSWTAPMRIIKPGDFEDDRVKALLTRHLEGMHANSPPEHVFALDWSGLQKPEISFYTLWEGDDLLGFGALKELDARSGEIKSMRTADAHLRTGVAAAILEHIIAEAIGRGYARLSLETGSGVAFEPALALYRTRGFINGPAFGGYERSPFNQFLHLDLPWRSGGTRGDVMADPESSETPAETIARLARDNRRLAAEKEAAEKTAEKRMQQADAASVQIDGAVSSITSALNGVKTTLAADTTSTDRLWRRSIALALAAVQPAGAWMLSTAIVLSTPGLFSTPPDVAPLLAFSVALAAYLATVRRELVKSLAGRTGRERRDRKIEAILVTGGEQATVLLGLLAVARIALFPGLDLGYDEFLIALLAVNIVYLAIVHVVEWML